MKLQLTKTKTIEISLPGGGGKSSSSTDMTGIELFCGDARGTPAVRIARKKSAWHVLAANFVKPPAGELPNDWEHPTTPASWDIPAALQAPHAAIAVNSPLAIFRQATADAITQDMAAGIPVPAAATAEPAKKRIAIRRTSEAKPAEPAPSAKPAAERTVPAFPAPGVPVAANGMRFVVRPLAEDGHHLEAALPEFQSLWLSRLLPEGHRPTASSIQVANAALMASVLVQPAFRATDGNALVMFLREHEIFFAGYKGGEPVLWRKCPAPGGFREMCEAVKSGLGVGDDMVESILGDTLVDPRSALEPFVAPILNELDLSRAYLSGKHALKIDRAILMGLPFGAAHWDDLAKAMVKTELVAPGVFDGFALPAKGKVTADNAFLTALGAALAAAEVEI